MRLTRKRPTVGDVDVDEAIADLRTGWLSRALDDREITLRTQSKVYFQISGAGHEALLLGLARSLRPAYDWFFPYYRDRALALALGVTPAAILMQAVGSAADPSSSGRQMPCHWGDPKLHLVSQTSATGSQCLPAVGCAEAARYIGRRELPGCEARGDEITYVSLGEGTTAQGEFWEAVNTAATTHLPVLFVVADNGYAISVRSSQQLPASISEMVRGHRGLHVTSLDGRDYFDTRRRGAEAIAKVRAGLGPGLIHAVVTRPYSHSLSDDQAKYRVPEDLESEAEHDPLDIWEEALIESGALSAEAAEAIRAEAFEEVARAADDALAAPRPSPLTVVDHVFGDAPEETPTVVKGRADRATTDDESPAPVTMGEAIRLTLHELCAADERIRVFGEDVADADPELIDEVAGKGGVFGITHGLQRTFGDARCFNTPLAEATIIGRAVGQALRGLRPCPEIQFFDYIWTAMQQLRTEAATLRWRSAGTFTCPMVVRVPIGGYLTGGAIWHSQCGESIFTHIPGLLVAFPSRARDAVGLLRESFRREDPVLFCEHKHLYRQGYARDPMPEPGWTIPFGQGAIVRDGDRATVVTWGATTQKAINAVTELARDDQTEVEVIDLRTLAPWDHDLVADSVRRIGKVLILHEDTLTSGFGAEIAAFVADECFEHLDAPVWRLAAIDTPVAYEPTLEAAILPQVDDIVADLRALIAY